MSEPRRPQTTTFLRWAGSKRKSLPALVGATPAKFARYVEPFAGSACLFFALQPARAVLADINADLIGAYQAIRGDVEEVIRNLGSFTCSEGEFYRVRSRRPPQMTPGKRAARFIYLNRLCFNGLYRTNKRGDFNVPYGGVKGGKLPSADLLRSCSIALRPASLLRRSFEQTLQGVRAGDFVYLDPPYAIESRRVFNAYSHFSFGAAELKVLRAELLRLDRCGVPFLVSYGVSREAYQLAKDFRQKETVVRRQIAGFAASRRRSRELLITNY